jgi:NTP pyrophosphatase (non-canonical NTP hydrolase)
MKNIDIYQAKTAETDESQKCTSPSYLYYVLGLCGESGEVAEKFKKLLRNKKGKLDDDFLEDITSELGDIMWYVSRLSFHLGLDMSEILDYNLEKLKSRKERGVLKSQGDKR